MKIAMKKPDPEAPMILYTPDGKVKYIPCEKDPSLEQLQELVGGYIEIVKRDDLFVYLADEDGLAKQLPLNPRYPPIVGNVLAVPKKHFK